MVDDDSLDEQWEEDHDAEDELVQESSRKTTGEERTAWMRFA